MTFASYITVSTTLLAFFHCESFPDLKETWLVVDYRIDCDADRNEKYYWFQFYAGE